MYNKSLNAFKLGKYNYAEKLILKYIKKNNKDEKALVLLARIYRKKKLYSKLIQTYKKLIRINKDIKILLELGNLYLENKKISQAISIFKELLFIDNKNELAINNIAYCYMLLNDYEKSWKYINKAIKISPSNEYLYFNLGNLYKKFGKLNLAIKSYNKAININPDNPNFKYNKSYIFLKKKLYKEGWKLYDNRILAEYKNTKIYNLIKNNIYKYSNVPINKKIIIVPEQGIGDEILFSSMYREFINLNPECKIIIDKRLRKIFKRSFSFSNFIPETNYKKISYYVKRKYDFIYAGSLGKFFRNKLSDFKGTSYLKPDIKRSNKYKKILSKYNKKIFIGISWKSQSKSMIKKTFKLNDIKKLTNIDNFGFVNLQYGNVSNEISDFNKKNKNKIIDFNDLDKFNDLDGLSALIASLDLVITVSNINTNLSSPLGVETWEITNDNHEHFFYSKNTKKCEWHNKLKIYYIKNNINEIISTIINDLKKKYKKLL